MDETLTTLRLTPAERYALIISWALWSDLREGKLPRDIPRSEMLEHAMILRDLWNRSEAYQ